MDAKQLARKIIDERELNGVLITGAGDRLRFNPGMVGDAEYICDTVERLSAADQQTLINARPATSAVRAIALRSLHINPSRTIVSLEVQAAAAALALLIADELQVVPV